MPEKQPGEALDNGLCRGELCGFSNAGIRRR